VTEVEIPWPLHQGSAPDAATEAAIRARVARASAVRTISRMCESYGILADAECREGIEELVEHITDAVVAELDARQACQGHDVVWSAEGGLEIGEERIGS